MRIKLRNNIPIPNAMTSLSGDFIYKYRGKWLDVDTKYLFRNSFNVSIDNKIIRIHNNYVSEIVDDVRLGLSVCVPCGELKPTTDNYICSICGKVLYELVPGSKIPEKGFDPVSLIESCFH